MNAKVVTSVVLLLTGAAYAADWNYDQDGADWATDGLGQCARAKQSPIDFDTLAIEPVHNVRDAGIDCITAADFSGGEEREMAMTNNGHGFYINTVDEAGGPAMTVKGGLLPFGKNFRFHSMHFHWGDDDTEGSEHQLNGEQFPLESHAIFFDDEAADLNEAIAMSNGGDLAAEDGGYRIGVFGIFFEVVEEDNLLLQPIIDKFDGITNKGDKVTGLHIALSDFLKDEYFGDFYTYLGSLTTPGCNELIRWHVSKAIVGVSSTQLAAFRSMINDGEGNVLDTNWRLPQSNTNPVWSVCSSQDLSGANDEICTIDLRGVKSVVERLRCEYYSFRMSLGDSFADDRLCHCVNMDNGA